MNRQIKRLTPFVAAAALLAGMVLRLATLPVYRREDAREPPVQVRAEITYRDLRRAVLLGIGVVLLIWMLIWFVQRTEEVLTLFVTAVILAVALRPTVDRLSNDRIPRVSKPIRRALAIVGIYMTLGTAIAALALVVFPQVAAEIAKLSDNGPEYLQQLDEQIRPIPGAQFLPPLPTLPGQLSQQIAGNLPQALSVIFLAVSTLTTLLSVVVVLVLTFFLILDADQIFKQVTMLVPPSGRGKLRVMTAKIGLKIEGWLKGIFLLSAFVGIGTSIGMWLLGMPYPLLLGVAAAIGEAIPLAGPYLASAPGLLLALFQPTWKLIAVGAFFLALQMVENHILAPAVMGREVEIPPLLVILSLLLGASLMGILGAILALPVAAVAQVVWTDLVVPEIKRRYVETE